MTRRYEIVYIFDSALEEAEVNQHLDRFHALLKNDDNPEPVENVNHWGKRTLAYPIKRREIGYYVVARIATDPTLLTEFERVLKLEESLIRHQLIVNEGEVPSPIAYATVTEGTADADTRDDARGGKSAS